MTHQSQFLAVNILQWAANTLDWCIASSCFVWRRLKNMSPCTGSRVNFDYMRITSCAGCQSRPQKLNATLPPATVSSVLATRPWTIRQKRIVTSCMISHTRHNKEIIPRRRDSPVGCLYRALAYCYIISVWRRHEFMSACSGSGVIFTYERTLCCAGCQ